MEKHAHQHLLEICIPLSDESHSIVLTLSCSAMLEYYVLGHRGPLLVPARVFAKFDRLADVPEWKALP